MGSYEESPHAEIGGNIPLTAYQQHEKGQLSFSDPETAWSAPANVLDPSLVDLDISTESTPVVH